MYIQNSKIKLLIIIYYNSENNQCNNYQLIYICGEIITISPGAAIMTGWRYSGY